jgi:quercetin dioxygenase-like cupin family protein
MPTEPMIISGEPSGEGREVNGTNLVIADWSMGEVGEVAPLHVHRVDDEAWHVVSGALTFRFSDQQIVAEAGSTVLVPAGTPHTFGNTGSEPSRFIIILPIALDELIKELHRSDQDQHGAVYRRFQSELLE